MPVNLLYNLNQSWNKKNSLSEINLIDDLNLNLIFKSMAGDDASLFNICKSILTKPLINENEIVMRQSILKDAIDNQSLFFDMYNVAVKTMEKTADYRKFTKPKYNLIVTTQNKVMNESEITDILIEALDNICHILSSYDRNFTSNYLIQFNDEIQKKYNKDYFTTVRRHLCDLSSLKLSGGVVIGGHIGSRMKLCDISLHRIINKTSTVPNLLEKSINKKPDAVILLDNEILINNGQEIENAGFIHVLKTLSNFNREITDFMESIKMQFGFYAGCINLYNNFKLLGIPLSFPKINKDGLYFEADELIDISLALKEKKPVIGNSISNKDKSLWIITGSNQGGKTTFLRSIGLAQLMAQCGLFVCAKQFCSNLYHGIFTHFPSGEDDSLKSGLLDEEMKQLSNLVSEISKGSLLLMNESFSTTTECDASNIAEEIIKAFKDSGIITIFVTHLYEFANRLYTNNPGDVVFYRALRTNEGIRTYKMKEGEPLKTSYGFDLYHQILKE